MSSREPIRIFIRRLLHGSGLQRRYQTTGRRQSLWQSPQLSTSVKMSSLGGAGIGAGLYAVVSNPAQIGAVPEDAKQKRHHLKNGKGFVNPWDSFIEVTQYEILVKYLFWKKITGQTKRPDTTPPTVPVVHPTFHPTRSTPKLRSTWLGHACYYIEYPSGLRVLFDPVFEECCAPFTMKNLKRFTPPPCEIEELPFVDLVVISHNHYDHLSYPTIQRIQKKFPDAHFFAPLGNKKWFESSGVKSDKVTELDWWESKDITMKLVKSNSKEKPSMSVTSTTTTTTTNDDDNQSNKNNSRPPQAITATISALPCQHVSARTPFDNCKTLWASWAVTSGGANVYFAGDTGYRSIPPSVPRDLDEYAPELSHLATCPAFRQIGEHSGPFDLGLIPIGAYEPRFMFSSVHASPKDAVNIFVDTKCKRALGMHWGTWVLTEEEVMEPPKKLKEALEWKGIADQSVFGVCDIGESREFESGGDGSTHEA